MDEHHQLLAAAYASGSVVGALLHRRAGWFEVVAEIFIAMTFTAFVTPVICEHYQLNDGPFCAMIGYLNGAFGFLFMMAVSVWIQNNDIVGRLINHFWKPSPP